LQHAALFCAGTCLLLHCAQAFAVASLAFWHSIGISLVHVQSHK